MNPAKGTETARRYWPRLGRLVCLESGRGRVDEESPWLVRALAHLPGRDQTLARQRKVMNAVRQAKGTREKAR